MMKKIGFIAAALTVALSAAPVQAKVSSADAAKLGTELTPLGGEKAGNADGSIPAWNGGLTSAPAGYTEGDFHPDPYAGEAPLFTITGANYKEHAEFLSDGLIKMFETYPDSFKLPVYKTHRSASNPQFVYDATKANATRAELLDGGNGMSGAAVGIPFPIPANGLEAIWNHIARYRGQAVQRNGGQAAVTAGGDYNVIGFDEQLLIQYSQENATPETLLENNVLFMFKQKVTKPARLAGTALLVHETLDQIKEPRKAWTYNTGQRRVRLAPNIAYDTPGTAADGLRTTDDFDMFNGSPNRYNWELKGKKEMYVAYNNYKLHSNTATYSDILKPNHVNPDLTRWEKHRVWVVEATLKDEFRHIYQKRVFFIDEDSWQIQLADMYDNRGELYRVAVAYGVNYYEVPTHWSTLDVYHDLNSRRYLAIGLDNEEQMYDFSVRPREAEFTPQALRREGTR
ncbi:MAG: DUF1329 domain-containing protein [Pseudomonadota bacterium]|jgi:hypothetical protein|uniref:Outer membrane lipoprotein-sorting protein n=1 Tax=Marisediminitalea aggregata TaxID=634436 RepID=A0A1M5PQY9_9ALTE|nr:DUF1329 domain-containing protein [Marisediminitalea aggregata]MAP19396.1 DUF1329 domain-containing protein [Alteromonadaceae bacterium]MCP4526565.1 DUF1329 domain-containing protein [Aestuariibacter sp.]MEC7823113.1 DUF1329 domain-containing protein [Pseudomonadota bacterium]HBY41322.1 DUF1329 domain-containing protein [Alteromonas sp.]MAX43634.1 DUF1329 domain-containing protein [Alteromonadaceae bacterium]|tara:strand:- start:19157 stop:20524 length:1368 start_codon:yes stop_codon:yes gene_type:complete